jgi:hypothetical protein
MGSQEQMAQPLAIHPHRIEDRHHIQDPGRGIVFPMQPHGIQNSVQSVEETQWEETS